MVDYGILFVKIPARFIIHQSISEDKFPSEKYCQKDQQETK